MRKAINPSSNQVRKRNFPGSMVSQEASARRAIAASAIFMRPLPAGLRSTTPPNTEYNLNRLPDINGAQGRIRTFVTRRVADLQSAAFNHSATCASLVHRLPRSTPHLPPNPVRDSWEPCGNALEGVAGGLRARTARSTNQFRPAITLKPEPGRRTGAKLIGADEGI